ncbi:MULTISPECIES: hypothetical protein [Erwinia]|uniref:hypothetical protein n=1 Tax=Erwinia TaxID=551 RepID=UPI0010608CCD|nr:MULTISPECIES: hypothetical protein [Erwinia]MBP2154149.1 hypothetical protein [Erwinia rhapontici]MCS3606892.1 hypothetical protein [Erwinia rhapontici]NKG30324.1 hypothetical protein [Erwinia rhapontici]NNS06746.1 hypothetical protein [Erwinia sp. JH02]BCQ38209.1 hypothetical protein ERHA54_08120 [Erwinia rhapontici]
MKLKQWATVGFVEMDKKCGGAATEFSWRSLWFQSCHNIAIICSDRPVTMACRIVQVNVKGISLSRLERHVMVVLKLTASTVFAGMGPA